MNILRSPVSIDLDNFAMHGKPVITQVRLLKDLAGIFYDHKAFASMNPETQAYSVQAWMPVEEGKPGGLYFGVSTIMPGQVGNEYFMTKGHYHSQSDRAEFYWGVKGKGMLILMDRNRNTWTEEVYPGSLHYIGSEIAHRLVNTGGEKLIVGACWPSDAGHDYAEIANKGFSARLLERDGESVLIEV